MSDGVEDDLHVGAQSLGGAQAMSRRIGIERQAAIEGHQLVDVGGRAELVEATHEGVDVADAASSSRMRAAWSIVQAEGSQRGRASSAMATLGVVERERRLAELARDQAHGTEEIAVGAARRERRHGIAQPGAGGGVEPLVEPVLQRGFGRHARILRRLDEETGHAATPNR